MSPAFTSRRRAEEFARALDGAGRDVDHAGHAGHADLVALVREIEALEPIAPSPDFSADLRERLMAEADSVLVERPRTATLTTSTVSARVDGRRRERRLAAAIGAVALIGGSGSVAMAAQSALPGDALYPIKRAVQDARATFSRDDGALLLAQASDRLDEAAALTVRDVGGDRQQVATALASFAEQADEGAAALLSAYADSGDAASVERVQEFTATSMNTLETLQTQVPPEAQDEFAEATGTVERIDAAASDACPDCRGSSTPVVFTASGTDLPTLPSTPDRGASGQDPDGDGQVDLPDVNPGELPPGSVNPGEAVNTPTQTTVLDPVRDLTQGLTQNPGGGDQPVTSTVTEPVRDLGGLLNQTLDPVTGLGDTIENTTDGVGDTLDGAVDGLTGR